MKVLATPRSFGKNNPELFDILRDAGLDVVRNDTGGILSADRMCEKLADCDGLIVGVDPVDATVLAAAPRLRAIAKYGVGLDNIDLAACEARGIKVSRTVGANSEAVADYALALMLGVARKVALIDRRCRERDWSKITGIDLYGKTVGIIGLGAIGKRVARRCGAGFGMKVLGHDIVWDDAWASENHVERADLERIFREADFISLHTSLDDSTRHLVDAPRLALMKPTATLINRSRRAGGRPRPAGGSGAETHLRRRSGRVRAGTAAGCPLVRPGQSDHGLPLLVLHQRRRGHHGPYGRQQPAPRSWLEIGHNFLWDDDERGRGVFW